MFHYSKPLFIPCYKLFIFSNKRNRIGSTPNFILLWQPSSFHFPEFFFYFKIWNNSAMCSTFGEERVTVKIFHFQFLMFSDWPMAGPKFPLYSKRESLKIHVTNITQVQRYFSWKNVYTRLYIQWNMMCIPWEKNILKTCKSCIIVHLKLLHSWELENLHYFLLQMTTSLWASLSQVSSLLGLPTCCWCSQLWPSGRFFYFWHFCEFWTCKKPLTGSIRNGTSVFIHITSLAQVVAPVLFWCSSWLCYRKTRSSLPLPCQHTNHLHSRGKCSV